MEKSGLPIKLTAADVYRKCESQRIPLGDTSLPLHPVGQARAESALRFGLQMSEPGYNIFSAGPSSVGKRWISLREAQAFASQKNPPRELIYVPDPGRPSRLQSLFVEPGRAYVLARNVDRFLSQISQAAGRDDCLLLIDDGITELMRAWPDEVELKTYLERLSAALRDQVQLVSDSVWLAPDSAHLISPIHPLWQAFRFHVMADHRSTQGAPVSILMDPDMDKLFGCVETPRSGAAIRIIPGMLHQLNGGVLIIDVQRLFLQSDVWDRLKGVLLSGLLSMRSASSSQYAAIECEPIPVSVKIILCGDRAYYNRFYERDPEFASLFKVVADFADSLPWDADTEQAYAQVIAHLAREHKLPTVTAAAVARLIEHGSRLAEDQNKLSLCFGNIADVMLEAAYCAGDKERIDADDIQQAIRQREYRSSQPCEELLDETERGELIIDTEGSRIGQVNGLSVIEQGEAICGHPSRITSRVHIGKGEVLDIEREIDLGGPIHSKGVLILHGYIAGRFVPNRSLSLSASLVFEQTYGGVEGDSASSAELFALLSALSDLPVNQSLAVTGSVNQMGDMQSVGAVNEKIEGFFNLCHHRGLTGEQGVIIPAANVQHLMLKQEVVDAIAAETFHIFAVHSVDQGMALLTGIPAGDRDANDSFPADTINGRVEARLLAMSDSGDDKEGSEKESGKDTADVESVEAVASENEPDTDDADKQSA